MSPEKLVAHLRDSAARNQDPEAVRLLTEAADELVASGRDLRPNMMRQLGDEIRLLQQQLLMLQARQQAIGLQHACYGCGALEYVLVGREIPATERFEERLCSGCGACSALYCPTCAVSALPECCEG